MKNLQEATERICDLKGSILALDAMVAALIHVLPAQASAELLARFAQHTELTRTLLLHAPISEHTIAAFERDVSRTTELVMTHQRADHTTEATTPT
jgi:hypothetical protein